MRVLTPGNRSHHSLKGWIECVRKGIKGIGKVGETLGYSWMRLIKRRRSTGLGSLEWSGCSMGKKTQSIFMPSQGKEGREIG